MTTIWIDAYLSPAIATSTVPLTGETLATDSLATWINNTFEGVSAFALRDLNLRDAEDVEIFQAAKVKNVIFVTKDSDFVDLVERQNAPPKIIWLTCGNTSNAKLKEILNAKLLDALDLLQAGEKLVEISGG